MSSYPSAALYVRPPQDPTEGIQRALTIKGMLQEQKLRQQSLQSGDLQLQQQQMDIDSTRAFTRAYQESGGDLNAVAPLAAKYGANPKALQAWQTSQVTLQKELEGLHEAKLKNVSAGYDFLARQTSAILQLPAEQRLPAVQQGIQQLVQQKAIDPDQGQQWLQSIPQDPAELESWLQYHTVSAMSAKDQAELQLNQRKTAAEEWKDAGPGQLINTRTGETRGTLRQPVDQQELSSYLAQNPGKTALDFMKYQKTMVPQFNFNLQNQGIPAQQFPEGTTPDQMYKSFGPKAGVIRGIVEGRQSPPSAFAQKTPYWQDVMQKVYQVDPQWSEQRAQLRKAFTTGQDGRNIGNLNTAVVHLDTLLEASKALQNGSFRPGNEIYNRVKTMFGAGAPTTFEGVRDAFAGEAAAALKGNATDIEIANVRRSIETKNSPEQLADYANEMFGVFHQKLDTYQQRYQQQNPGDTVWSPILPQAQSVFDKHGVTGAGGNGGGGAAKEYDWVPGKGLVPR